MALGTIVMAQNIITLEPANATVTDEITITLDAKLSCPDSALFAADSVMMHSGLTVDGAAWSNVVEFNGVGADGMRPKLTNNGDSTWSITFVPANFYGVTENVTAINCVFNGGDWAAGEGKDFTEEGECTDFTLALGTTGITNPDAGAFRIYPNPVDNQLNVENINGVTKIEIFNVIGEKVMSFENINGSKAIITTNSLNSGIYLMNIHLNNTVQTTKFVKK